LAFVGKKIFEPGRMLLIKPRTDYPLFFECLQPRGQRVRRVGGLLIWRSPRLARIIDAVPQHWLIGVQLYRALGVIFLILYAAGKLPGLFAWPAGLGDVLVGVLAPVVAIAYRRGPRENPDLVSAWNLFGLVDLIVAVTAGMLSSP
jgi:hypothetical protein